MCDKQNEVQDFCVLVELFLLLFFRTNTGKTAISLRERHDLCSFSQHDVQSERTGTFDILDVIKVTQTTDKQEHLRVKTHVGPTFMRHNPCSP